MNSVMLKVIAECIKESPDINAELRYSRLSNSGRLYYRDSIDIAVPMLTAENRMITPIVRNLGVLNLRETCQAMERLKHRAHHTKVDLLMLEAGLQDTWMRLARGQFLTVLRRLWANFVARDRITLPSREERGDMPKSRRRNALPRPTCSMPPRWCPTRAASCPCRVPRCPARNHSPQLTAMLLSGIQKKPVVMRDESGQDIIVIREIMPLTFYLDHRALDFEHVIGFLKRLRHLCAHPEELLQEIPV